jgi:hypothetical protein
LDTEECCPWNAHEISKYDYLTDKSYSLHSSVLYKIKGVHVLDISNSLPVRLIPYFFSIMRGEYAITYPSDDYGISNRDIAVLNKFVWAYLSVRNTGYHDLIEPRYVIEYADIETMFDPSVSEYVVYRCIKWTEDYWRGFLFVSVGTTIPDSLLITCESLSDLHDSAVDLWPNNDKVLCRDIEDHVVAGGHATSMFLGIDSGDVDYFHIRNQDNSMSLKHYMLLLDDLEDDEHGATYVETKNSYSVFAHSDDDIINMRSQRQIIRRAYESITDVLFDFDIDSARCAYNNHTFYMTRTFAWAVLNRANFINSEFYTASMNKRLTKYCYRGFDIISGAKRARPGSHKRVFNSYLDSRNSYKGLQFMVESYNDIDVKPTSPYDWIGEDYADDDWYESVWKVYDSISFSTSDGRVTSDSIVISKFKSSQFKQSMTPKIFETKERTLPKQLIEYFDSFDYYQDTILCETMERALFPNYYIQFTT